MALHYKIIPVTPFQQNCSLIWCSKTMQAAIVDPGGDVARIQAAIAAEGVTLNKILLTHGHLDHVGGSADLAKAAGVKIIGPQREDAFWIDNLAEQCRMFGFPPVPLFQPDQWLEEGETVSVGEEVLEVIYTPGHTPGHIVFYSGSAQLALVGDVLFAGSIGRTDFPRGNHKQLLDSIRLKLWPLGREVEFIPGHGPMSTFGEEIDSNPFVAGRAG